MLEQLFERRVSDIFICPSKPVCVRVHGEVESTSTIAPPEETLIECLNNSGDIQIAGKLSDAQKHPAGSIDGAIAVEGKRFRYNFYRALDTETMRQTVRLALRPLSDHIPVPEEIGLASRILADIDEMRQGLVLVCGKTGQGKSTTLASLLQHRANQFKEHIITLEQPIEYVLKGSKAIVSQRDVGTSVNTFATGLRAALRQNPDTILVGEVRDRETAEIALSASESGHLVFGTLHTSNAAQSIERFVNIFPSDEQPAVWNVLSTALKAILCQILVRSRDGGRVAVREILMANPSVSSYIKAGDLNGVRRALESGFNEYGMQNWSKAAELLYRQGLIADTERKNIIALGE